jgi:DNA polymerase-3 subunit chi
MKQFSIYQTTEELLVKGIILLVEKCYHNSLKTVISVSNQELQESLNKTLWTYARKQFIPHGSKFDPMAEKQPIYITSEIENPNDASVLLIASLARLEEILKNSGYISGFQRIIITYDDATSLDELKSRVCALVSIKKSIDCYKQDAIGVWNKIYNAN